MREVKTPRMLSLTLLICVLGIATWQPVSASCQGQINVAVAMDASQSLGKLNFLHVKAFTKAIAEHLLTDNDEANFFTVAFAREVDVIVGEKMNVNETIAKIDDFDKQLIAETNTNLAIEKCSSILKTKGDPDKPSVIFIVTDGRATSGLQVVIETAKAAAAEGNILVAIGVGKDFAYEELLYITAGRKEHVLNGTFANLNLEVLDQTLKTICHLSVTDPTDPTIVRPTCQNDGTVAIGVEVSPSLSALERQQMTLLLDMMSPGTNVSLSNGDTMTPFHSVATFMNASNNINSAPIPKDTLLQTMKDSLRRQQTGPKVAVLIIDDSYWKTNLNNLIIAKNQVEEANKLGITVIALVVGRQSAGMERVLTTIFGTVNKLSVNSITMDAIVTSGFNQLLNRICTVLSVPDPVTTLPTTTTTPVTTTPPPIDNFGGAFDVYITFDVCQAVPQGNVNFGTYGHFASILANKLIFGPLNVSLTTSLTYCSGVEVIAKSRDYIFESHYSFRWARDRLGGTVYAADIVYDIIEKWDNTLENVGIIFITENMVEDGLQSVVNKARALNITLMAVTLTSSGGPSQAMAEKAAIIDGSYVHMTYNDLYTLPGLVRTIMQRIPNLFRVPMQTVVGITLDDTLSLEQYASVDVFLQTLRKMITSVIKDKQYTESFQLELFNKLEVSRRANILRRIEYYTRVSLNKPDFIIIITNRPPLDTDLIAAAMNKSMESGVQVFMTGFTGALSQSVDTIASQIDKENKSVVILIDSSESVSKEDFFSAYKTSAALMWRLNNTVNVEVSTFDVNVNVEIPMTEYSITSRAGFVGKLYQMTHLMTKPPLYKAVEKMAEMAEINDIDDDDVRMVGVMFIADRPRYMNLLDLFKNYIYANRSTLIVVDVSLGGNIEGLEQDPLLFPMHIIRTRNLEFDTLPGQILEFLNSTGYSKYHTVFTAGQISSIEGKFNLFENMLQAFRNAADNYNFNTDFGLITMENNALFDYFDLSMDEIIYILRRLMKVSDRGSETAIDYSSALFREHKMAETQQKQGVSLVVTDENPKFPNVVATKAARARDEDGNHALVIGVGDTLDTSSLLSLNNVGDDSLCIASDGVDLRTNCVGWLVDRLKTLPTITPIQSSTTTTTEPTTTTTSSSTGSNSPTLTTNTPPPTSTNKPTLSTTKTTTTVRTIPTSVTTPTPVPLSTASAASESTIYNTTIHSQITSPAATETLQPTQTTNIKNTPTTGLTVSHAATQTTSPTVKPLPKETTTIPSTTTSPIMITSTTPLQPTMSPKAQSTTSQQQMSSSTTPTQPKTSLTTPPQPKTSSTTLPQPKTSSTTPPQPKTSSTTPTQPKISSTTPTQPPASSTTKTPPTKATTKTQPLPTQPPIIASSTTQSQSTASISTTLSQSTTSSATRPQKTTATSSTISSVTTTIPATTTATSASSQSTVTPFHYVCNADAHVGIGVSSNLQVRDVFEILQENITQSIGDDVKFKFLVFYNSQLFQPNTEMKSSDPKAFQSVVEEVNARLTNLYTGQSNLVALLFTDAKSAADGISSDVLNVLSTYIDFVVFGIGQFSDSATADLKRLTKNMAHSLIIVDDVASLDYDNSVAFLGKAVCDAVTKTPVVDIRTNITKICSIQPLDSSFDLDARNVQYPFDCTKLINCKRMGSSIRADVQSCPQNTRFNTDTHMCDIRQDVKCKEFTATEYALEIGKIIEPPIPKVVNLTEECINNCFKAGDLTDNYGYTYHPTDCSKFIVCRRQGYINPGYTFITRVENCPAGLFWNAQRKMCVPTHLAECAADMCKTKSMFALWNVNCRQFYKCDSGHSRLEHCAYGKKFQSGGYCVDDAEHTCKVTIVKPETCYNLPWTDSTMYIDRTIGDNGKLTSCPVGKMYDHQTCTCSRNYVTGTCQPLISETMDSTRTINNVWMRAGAATFMGLGMLTYTQPSPLTNTFLVHVVISVSKSNQDVVMLSSCQTPDTSAISLRLINDRLTAQVGMAGGTMTLTSKIQFDAWNHVYLAYNDQKIVLKTDSATDQVSASGTIQGCQNDYVLGSEYGFYGDVDELNVYDCIPEKYISIFN